MISCLQFKLIAGSDGLSEVWVNYYQLIMISTDRPDFGRPKKDIMRDDDDKDNDQDDLKMRDDDEREVIVNIVSDCCNNISVPGQT